MRGESGTPSFKEMERQGWHRNAPDYHDRAGQVTTQAIRRLIDAVAVQPGMQLIDLCCGPGYAAGAAAERGLAAMGVDIAPAMIEEARRRFPHAEFRLGDAEALDLPDASFDAVICAFGMLHLPEPEKGVAEAFRVLRPGGRYAFTVWCTPNKAKLLGLALDAVTAHGDMTVPLPPAPSIFQFSDPLFGTAALEDAGFRDVVVEEVPIHYRGKAIEDLFDWFDKSTVRTMALFRLQKPEVQERIKKAILDGARAYFVDGQIQIPCPAVLYTAAKR
jgi:ubiquinone/menaquinone biosynthesis C-methylase UbiE